MSFTVHLLRAACIELLTAIVVFLLCVWTLRVLLCDVVTDVKGCDEAVDELRDVVEFLKHPEKFTRLGAKMNRGILLLGP